MGSVAVDGALAGEGDVPIASRMLMRAAGQDISMPAMRVGRLGVVGEVLGAPEA